MTESHLKSSMSIWAQKNIASITFNKITVRLLYLIINRAYFNCHTRVLETVLVSEFFPRVAVSGMDGDCCGAFLLKAGLFLLLGTLDAQMTRPESTGNLLGCQHAADNIGPTSET